MNGVISFLFIVHCPLGQAGLLTLSFRAIIPPLNPEIELNLISAPAYPSPHHYISPSPFPPDNVSQMCEATGGQP
jgi:hypothetical protein